ncbi:MAG: hypothetical protein HYZ75_03955 [Elusimicrobia bacterium]|nr:hypothetical protein [Elusimicrobiota bacterium]
MNEPGDYQDQRRDYERPNQPLRCGRARTWSKPCRLGPKPDGTCGGMTECSPFLAGARWECRRPASAGGPCAEGPRPDGSCSQTHPPCAPLPVLRSIRGRLTVAAGAACAAALAFLAVSGPARRAKAFSPGPLSSRHAGVVGEKGCAACHRGHTGGASGLLAAAFDESPGGVSCVSCHAGATAAAHDRPGFAATRCTQCHTEHRSDRPVTRISEAQCQTCHKVKFESFASDHPAFSPEFPGGHPAVRFDHAAHLGRHFKAPGAAGKAPVSCVSCHELDRLGRRRPPADFNKTCAGCHAAGITNDLIALRLPESGSEADALTELSAPERWLLEVSPKDAGRYTAKITSLSEAIGTKGVPALEQAVGRRAKPKLLLAGLDDSTLKSMSPAAKAPASGWFWYEDMLKELHYKPEGHADPVLKAWLEAGAAASGGVRKGFLDPKGGPGACMRCHVEQRGQISWSAGTGSLTRFAHAPHERLMGCADCHKTGKGAGSFAPIARESCLKCHAHENNRLDCRSCHSYHAAGAAASR